MSRVMFGVVFQAFVFMHQARDVRYIMHNVTCRFRGVFKVVLTQCFV